MIEKIEFNNELIAIIINKNFCSDGVTFLTEDSTLLQVGYLSHSKGHRIQPHVHSPIERNIIGTQEVLFVKSGRIRIDFYSCNKVYLQSRDFSSGDIILLAGGGHGITMLDNAEIVEVKNGPFVSGSDKIRFEGEKYDTCE